MRQNTVFPRPLAVVAAAVLALFAAFPAWAASNDAPKGAAQDQSPPQASLAPDMHPLAVGQPFPDVALSPPLNPGEARELGIDPKAKSVTAAEFKAQAVILVVYSMYCPFCQREAPELNALHKLIQDKGLSDRLKIVGLAAGNSPFEVNVFREKYAIAFPLLPDKDFVAHKALGQVGTPFYYVLKREGNGFAIVDTHLGCVSSQAAFLDEVIAKTALGQAPAQGKQP